jgi:hypothetical protein
MLEYVQAAALLGLLISHYFLIKGCFKINENLPIHGGEITTKVGGVTEVLDEIADLLNEGLAVVAGSGSAQTPSSPMDAILSGLISSMTNRPTHGSQTQERTIHEINTPPTIETENELD